MFQSFEVKSTPVHGKSRIAAIRGLFGEHGAGVGNTGKADAPRALVDTEPTVDGGQARQRGLRLGGRGWLLG